MPEIRGLDSVEPMERESTDGKNEIPEPTEDDKKKLDKPSNSNDNFKGKKEQDCSFEKLDPNEKNNVPPDLYGRGKKVEKNGDETQKLTQQTERGIDKSDKSERPPEYAEQQETQDVNEGDSYEDWKRTPIKNGEWEDERGQSKWIPEGEDVKEILGRYGTDGIEYKNNYPKFDRFSAFECDLNEDEYTASNPHQFQKCNEAMTDYFSDLSDKYAGVDCDDPLSNAEYRDIMMDTFKCNEKDLENIQTALELGETPYGYTWHHTETPGRMQLVPSAIHDAARHRGGQTIWGGGNENR